MSNAWKMEYKMKVSSHGKAEEKAHLKWRYAEIIKG